MTWLDEPQVKARLEAERDDLLTEVRGTDGTFTQNVGPFSSYLRTIETRPGKIIETTIYSLKVPWFGWLLARPVRHSVARRWHHPRNMLPHRTPWWTPPDQLTSRQVLVLGLLAAASMSSAFTNTIFTQTASFAAADFGVGSEGFANAGSIVRAGIVIALPLAFLADRIGRQKVIRIVAWAAPLITALGAIAPTFSTLVATQAVGRPLGLALDFMIAVVAAEEVPRNSRAYAVSIMAMASGIGAGVAVAALPLADLGEGGWRLVYVVALVWLFVAVDITRRLPETERFARPHRIAPPIDRKRFAILATVAVLANLFVAPANYFQNTYLRDIRGFDATTVAIFTLITATPAAIGLIIGGRLADVRGRRKLIAATLPVATMLILGSFVVAGPPMWLAAFGGGFVGGIAYPAIAVYRTELFPTGSRGRASGMLTAVALGGGIIGLQVVGRLLDSGYSYGRVFGLVALGQVVVVITVLKTFPETAHRALEDLNPLDDRRRDAAPDLSAAPVLGTLEPALRLPDRRH